MRLKYCRGLTHRERSGCVDVVVVCNLCRSWTNNKRARLTEDLCLLIAWVLDWQLIDFYEGLSCYLYTCSPIFICYLMLSNGCRSGRYPVKGLRPTARSKIGLYCSEMNPMRLGSVSEIGSDRGLKSLRPTGPRGYWVHKSSEPTRLESGWDRPDSKSCNGNTH